MAAMKSALILALLLVLGAGTLARDAKLSDVLRNFRNLSPSQIEHLKNAILQGAEKAVHGYIQQFRKLVSDLPTGAEPVTLAPVVPTDDYETIADIVRRILREGVPSYGIPPLDPFECNNSVPIDLELPDVLTLKATLSDLSLSGLSDFKEDVNSGILLFPTQGYKVEFDVLIPDLHIQADYAADGYAEPGLAIWGEGPMRIHIYGLRVNGTVSLRLSLPSQTLTVNICELDINSPNVKFEIEGLFGGGLLSQLTGEIITDMINEYVWQSLIGTVSSTVHTEVCNDLSSVSSVTWWYIVRYILSVSGSSPTLSQPSGSPHVNDVFDQPIKLPEM